MTTVRAQCPECGDVKLQIDDLTERKRMEDVLFEEKELIRLTLQSIGDAVLCTDAAGHVTLRADVSGGRDPASR